MLDDFLKTFTIHVSGYGSHLGQVTWTIYANFGSPFPRRLHVKLALIGQAVSDEIFQNGWETTPADGWTPERGYTISSTCVSNDPGELTIVRYFLDLTILCAVHVCPVTILCPMYVCPVTYTLPCT